MNIIPINSKLLLPCGVELKNRLAKSAMSETLGTWDNRPTENLSTLYGRWAKGGTGLVITGNVMIDRRALGEPNNVAIEDESHLNLLRSWAAAGIGNQTSLWVQLNHPGRQAPVFLNREAVAPSAVPLDPKMAPSFAKVRELTEDEIQDLIARFGTSARIVKEAGFSGVQIHGAHGYLVSQFLSPHVNRRKDKWGGSIENRMRFVTEVYKSIRSAVGPKFPIGIKLNSADFQKGGFTDEDSMIVAEMLSSMGIDLIEISGGTYEAPVMAGPRKESTAKREAYFMDYCEKVRKRIQKTPLMLTGGFRTGKGIQDALNSGACDLVGLARTLAIQPDFSNQLIKDPLSTKSMVHPITTGIKQIDRMAMMEVIWYTRQLNRMAKGENPWIGEPGWYSMACTMLKTGARALNTRLRA